MNAITIAPRPGLTTVRVDGQIIAASLAALELQEAGYPPVTYVPLAHTLAGAHRPAPKRTRCPYKGEAAYVDVAGHSHGGWIYFDPISAVAPIARHIAYDRTVAEVQSAALPEAPDAAREVLKFWFDELKPAQQFKADPALDQQIRDRFGSRHTAATEGQLTAWEDHPDGTLALLILFDQFSRNIFRGAASAFAHDGLARQVASGMIEKGFDLALAPDRRPFAYLPFMHSEDLEDQNRSVELFSERLPGSDNLRFALSHRADIHRYGRFPYRDAALGRTG